jgi:hypothetical protein
MRATRRGFIMAEHVTLFRMKGQPGKRQAVIDRFERWEREHKTGAKGLSGAKMSSVSERVKQPDTRTRDAGHPAPGQQ